MSALNTCNDSTKRALHTFCNRYKMKHSQVLVGLDHHRYSNQVTKLCKWSDTFIRTISSVLPKPIFKLADFQNSNCTKIATM